MNNINTSQQQFMDATENIRKFGIQMNNSFLISKYNDDIAMMKSQINYFIKRVHETNIAYPETYLLSDDEAGEYSQVIAVLKKQLNRVEERQNKLTEEIANLDKATSSFEQNLDIPPIIISQTSDTAFANSNEH
jgi:hypothetical protein